MNYVTNYVVHWDQEKDTEILNKQSAIHPVFYNIRDIIHQHLITISIVTLMEENTIIYVRSITLMY
jgi:hypothetical protein